jgi:membrane protein DedA with SNARE-associated domain
MIFMIFYKGLWVLVVAYPLWKAGTLAGSPAAEMNHIFFWAVIVGVLIVPWVYVLKTFVLPSKPQLTQ